MEEWQKIDMLERIRELRMAGKPELAAPILEAFERDEFYMGEGKLQEPKMEVPKRSGQRSSWVHFALENSLIDPEVIDGAKRNDIIGMLEANGIIEREE